MEPMQPNEPNEKKEATEQDQTQDLKKQEVEMKEMEKEEAKGWREFVTRNRMILIPGASFLVLALCIGIWFVVSYGGSRAPVAPTPEALVATTSQPTLEPTMEPTPSPEPTPESRKGQVVSKLTGDWVPKKAGERRPYAVMINNIGYAAGFHSGISQASVLYEAMVEGGITRCLAIFEDFDSKRIGSVRSARHYYVSFAKEYDSIFVHYGQTKYALAKMKELGTDNLSGLEGVGSSVFFRDNAYSAPHNAFASYKGVIKGTKIKDYRKKYKKDQESHFQFYPEDTDLEGKKAANRVDLKFSGLREASPYFKYNAKKKLYYRYTGNGKHIDHENGKQLSFKNLIVQFVQQSNIDRNGYQTMKLDGAKGKGWYVTNGKAVKITWEKKGNKGRTRYFDESGNEINVNVGKTYIAVFPNNRTKDVVISKGKK